jgi:hypothetical protein
LIELASCPAPEGFVAPVLPADCDELKVIVQLPGGAQGCERGQEVPRCEVACGPEYDQLTDHAINLPALGPM